MVSRSINFTYMYMYIQYISTWTQTLYLILSTLVITKPPYEVNESGWGEFEITIKIFFMDPQERPVSIHTMYMYVQYYIPMRSPDPKLFVPAG